MTKRIISKYVLTADTGEGPISVAWNINNSELILLNTSRGELKLDANETDKIITDLGCVMAGQIGEAVGIALLIIKEGSKNDPERLQR